MKFYNKVCFIALILLSALSCNDDLGIKDDKIDLVRVKDGYLDFKDKDAFNQVTQQLKGKSVTELDTWEKSLPGFTSIISIYKEALQQEEIFLDNGGESVGQSEFFRDNLEAFYLNERKDILPNVPSTDEWPMISLFVNKYGLVKIGASLFEFRAASIKEIRDSDPSKIDLLSSTLESSKERNISVINIIEKDITKTTGLNMKTAFSGTSSCSDLSDGGGQRVRGYVMERQQTMVDIWGQTPFPGQVVFKTTIDTEAYNDYKGVFGWRGKPTGALRILGNVTINGVSTSVDHGTGGQTVSSITKLLYSSGWTNLVGSPVYDFFGSLTFYGRDYTECSI